MVIFGILAIILKAVLFIAFIYCLVKLFNAKNAEEFLSYLLILIAIASPYIFK